MIEKIDKSSLIIANIYIALSWLVDGWDFTAVISFAFLWMIIYILEYYNWRSQFYSDFDLMKRRLSASINEGIDKTIVDLKKTRRKKK
jgi:hypothetical protein